ncbi:hypothetical protein [Mycobacterium sherrisii]|nr:hypothetical protein [Mycobacterium sherrisii]MEC4765088.1 hypothetical protein [Mycobacterium sherrisii]
MTRAMAGQGAAHQKLGDGPGRVGQIEPQSTISRSAVTVGSQKP